MISLDEILTFDLDHKFECQITQNSTKVQKSENSAYQKQYGIKSKKKQAKYEKALWTLEENSRYASFLQKNKELFDSSLQKRRSIKINQLISQEVGSRSAVQCRSHHQKMLKHHHTISGILQYVRQLKEYAKKQNEAGIIKSSYRIGRNQLLFVQKEQNSPKFDGFTFEAELFPVSDYWLSNIVETLDL